MFRTVFTLTLVFAVCLFAGAQQPEPPGWPAPPRVCPPLEPDPIVRRLNDEEVRIRAKQEELKQRLVAIGVEKEQAKKRSVGKIEATVEGLLSDVDKPHPYLLCRFTEQLECRVYLVTEDFPSIPGTDSAKFQWKGKLPSLEGKVVVASGRLAPYPPDEKRGIPAGAMRIDPKSITTRIEELTPLALPKVPDGFR